MRLDEVGLLLPTLPEAIERWRSARRNFMRRSGSATLDAFNHATALLFVLFVADNAEERWAAKAFQAFREALIGLEQKEDAPTSG